MRVPYEACRDDLHFAQIDLESGSAAVYFVERSGSLVPVEVTFFAVQSREIAKQTFSEPFFDKEYIRDLPRISSQLIRSLSLSEAVATITSTKSKQKETGEDMDENNFSFSIGVDSKQYGFRNIRDLVASVERFRAAQIYANEVSKGNLKPALTVATQMTIPVGRARALIAGARRDGFLTSNSPGISGGQLTQKAEDFRKLFSSKTGGRK